MGTVKRRTRLLRPARQTRGAHRRAALAQNEAQLVTSLVRGSESLASLSPADSKGKWQATWCPLALFLPAMEARHAYPAATTEGGAERWQPVKFSNEIN